MIKIIRDYDIPGGKYCRLTNGGNLEQECGYLLDGKYCTIFGCNPSRLAQGNVVGIIRLKWCQACEEKAKRLLSLDQGQTGPHPLDGPAAE